MPLPETVKHPHLIPLWAHTIGIYSRRSYFEHWRSPTARCELSDVCQKNPFPWTVALRTWTLRRHCTSTLASTSLPICSPCADQAEQRDPHCSYNILYKDRAKTCGSFVPPTRSRTFPSQRTLIAEPKPDINTNFRFVSSSSTGQLL